MCSGRARQQDGRLQDLRRAHRWRARGPRSDLLQVRAGRAWREFFVDHSDNKFDIDNVSSNSGEQLEERGDRRHYGDFCDHCDHCDHHIYRHRGVPAADRGGLLLQQRAVHHAGREADVARRPPQGSPRQGRGLRRPPHLDQLRDLPGLPAHCARLRLRRALPLPHGTARRALLPDRGVGDEPGHCAAPGLVPRSRARVVFRRDPGLLVPGRHGQLQLRREAVHRPAEEARGRVPLLLLHRGGDRLRAGDPAGPAREGPGNLRVRRAGHAQQRRPGHQRRWRPGPAGRAERGAAIRGRGALHARAGGHLQGRDCSQHAALLERLGRGADEHPVLAVRLDGEGRPGRRLVARAPGPAFVPLDGPQRVREELQQVSRLWRLPDDVRLHGDLLARGPADVLQRRGSLQGQAALAGLGRRSVHGQVP
mmetsp:Transcript_51636/g.139155  ORF Transcript_51636/g.139155 Transcript_51636/m.139155 type:complete len:423 (+) Transcript_51636:412-1680(+)